MESNVNPIINGSKIRNEVLMKLFFKLKEFHNMTYREITYLFLSLDQAVESGEITNQILLELKGNKREKIKSIV